MKHICKIPFFFLQKKSWKKATGYCVTPVPPEFMHWLVTNFRHMTERWESTCLIWIEGPGTIPNFTTWDICKLYHGVVKYRHTIEPTWANLAQSHSEVEWVQRRKKKKEMKICCFMCQQTLETCLYCLLWLFMDTNLYKHSNCENTPLQSVNMYSWYCAILRQ